MGAEEVERFLTHLATADKVAASTQNQALNALVFLYRQVLQLDLGNFDAVLAGRCACQRSCPSRKRASFSHPSPN